MEVGEGGFVLGLELEDVAAFALGEGRCGTKTGLWDGNAAFCELDLDIGNAEGGVGAAENGLVSFGWGVGVGVEGVEPLRDGTGEEECLVQTLNYRKTTKS